MSKRFTNQLIGALVVLLLFAHNAFCEQSDVLKQITYQLDVVWKKKIKSGKVIEEKVEPMGFLDAPYIYVIKDLHTKTPLLQKFIGKKLVEQNTLVLLNLTAQGNIYLADISAIGNVFLLSVFPSQQTIAVSWQYWLSHEDVVILWQGIGSYRK